MQKVIDHPIRNELQVTMCLDDWVVRNKFGDFNTKKEITKAFEYFIMITQQVFESGNDEGKFTVSYYYVNDKEFFVLSVPITVPEECRGCEPEVVLNQDSQQRQEPLTDDMDLDEPTTQDREGIGRLRTLAQRELGEDSGLDGVTPVRETTPHDDDDDDEFDVGSLEETLLFTANDIMKLSDLCKKNTAYSAAFIFYDMVCNGTSHLEHDFTTENLLYSEDDDNRSSRSYKRTLRHIFSYSNTIAMFKNVGNNGEPELMGQWQGPITKFFQSALLSFELPFCTYELYDRKFTTYFNTEVCDKGKYNMRMPEVNMVSNFSQHAINSKKFLFLKDEREPVIPIRGDIINEDRSVPTGVETMESFKARKDEYKRKKKMWNELKKQRIYMIKNRYHERKHSEQIKLSRKLRISGEKVNKYRAIPWIELPKKYQLLKDPLYALHTIIRQVIVSQINILESKKLEFIEAGFEDYVKAKNDYETFKHYMRVYLHKLSKECENPFFGMEQFKHIFYNNLYKYMVKYYNDDNNSGEDDDNDDDDGDVNMKDINHDDEDEDDEGNISDSDEDTTNDEFSPDDPIRYDFNDELPDDNNIIDSWYEKFEKVAKKYYKEKYKLDNNSTYKTIQDEIDLLNKEKIDIWNSWCKFKDHRTMMFYSVENIIDSSKYMKEEYLNIPEETVCETNHLYKDMYLTVNDAGIVANSIYMNNLMSLLGLKQSPESFIRMDFSIISIFDLSTDSILNIQNAGPPGCGKSHTMQQWTNSHIDKLAADNSIESSKKSEHTVYKRLGMYIDQFSEIPVCWTVDENDERKINSYLEELQKYKVQFSSSDPFTSYFKFAFKDKEKGTSGDNNFKAEIVHRNRKSGYACSNYSMPHNGAMRDRFLVECMLSAKGIGSMIVSGLLHKAINSEYTEAKKKFINTIRLADCMILKFLLYSHATHNTGLYLSTEYYSILCYKFINQWRTTYHMNSLGPRSVKRLITMLRATTFTRVFNELFMFDRSPYRYSKEHGRIMKYTPERMYIFDQEEIPKDLPPQEATDDEIFKSMLIRCVSTLNDVSTAISFFKPELHDKVDKYIALAILETIKLSDERTRYPEDFPELDDRSVHNYYNKIKKTQHLDFKYIGNNEYDPNYVNWWTNKKSLNEIAGDLVGMIKEKWYKVITVQQGVASLKGLFNITIHCDWKYKPVIIDREKNMRFNYAIRNNISSNLIVKRETSGRKDIYFTICIKAISELLKKCDRKVDENIHEVFFTVFGKELSKDERAGFFSKKRSIPIIADGNEFISHKTEKFEVVNEFIDNDIRWDLCLKKNREKEIKLQLQNPKYQKMMRENKFIIDDPIDVLLELEHYNSNGFTERDLNEMYTERSVLFAKRNKLKLDM